MSLNKKYFRWGKKGLLSKNGVAGENGIDREKRGSLGEKCGCWGQKGVTDPKKRSLGKKGHWVKRMVAGEKRGCRKKSIAG